MYSPKREGGEGGEGDWWKGTGDREISGGKGERGSYGREINGEKVSDLEINKIINCEQCDREGY